MDRDAPLVSQFLALQGLCSPAPLGARDADVYDASQVLFARSFGCGWYLDRTISMSFHLTNASVSCSRFLEKFMLLSP